MLDTQEVGSSILLPPTRKPYSRKGLRAGINFKEAPKIWYTQIVHILGLLSDGIFKDAIFLLTARPGEKHNFFIKLFNLKI